MRTLNFIYEDIDITDDVQIKKAVSYDNASGKADSIEIEFSDTEELWSQWRPQKSDKILLKELGFSTGKMYIDEIGQKSGTVIVRAISTPPNAKTKNTRSWENIRFKKVAQDLANFSGLKLATYNIKDWLYTRVDQLNETDLECLNRLCIREGYALKITDGKAVIYDERIQEQQEPVLTLYKQDFIGEYNFLSTSNGIKRSCIVRHMNQGQLIQYEFFNNSQYGGRLKINEYVSSQAEAERFSKGYLRSANKYETTLKAAIELNAEIAAGNMIEVLGVGLANGVYFVDQIILNFAKNQSILTLRRPLEGY